MPALLLALTGLDRAALKAGAAVATGLLLALSFAVSTLTSLVGASSSAAAAPPAALAAIVPGLPAGSTTTGSRPAAPPPGANAAVALAFANLGSLRWHNAAGDSLCEQFVENMYGTTGEYPSAIAAWLSQAPADPARLAQQRNLAAAPVGARLYFFDPTQPDGHAGIYVGNGAFIGANDRAVELWEVGAWLTASHQSFLGWVAP